MTIIFKMHTFLHFILIFFVFSRVHSQDIQNDINVNYLGSSSSGSQDDDFVVISPAAQLQNSQDERDFVRLLKGCPSAIAEVDKVFTYVIPNDAFEGPVLHYEFIDLPNWLTSHKDGKILEGVPPISEVGDHYIGVVAVGPSGLKAKDELSIEVQASNGHLDTNCHQNTDVLFLNVVLQAPNYSAIKVRVVRSVAKIFDVDVSQVSISKKRYSHTFGGSSILSGGRWIPPSSGLVDHHKRLYVRLPIGCGLKVSSKVRDELKIFDHLRNITDATIIRWFVIEVDPVNNRVRRETDYSGDYVEYDYEYDYSDIFPVDPAEKSSSSPATPTFTDLPAMVSAAQGSPISPVFKEVPLSTPTFIPVKPTKLVVEPSPTVTAEADYTAPPRNPTELESSLLTHPTTSADYTTPLSGVSSTFGGDATRILTERIDATSMPEEENKERATEYVVRNFPPRIESRIQKLGWIAGTVYRMRIPEDTFVDFEDGNTRNLSLVLKDETGNVFGRNSWIQIDPTNQEVYALPLEQHIGRYDFRLEAIDKGRKSAIDFLEVSVWQHNQVRVFHHQFTAVLKLEKKYEYEFAYALDWQVKAVEKIAVLFQDSVSNINIRSITTDPVKISWTNVSLVNSISADCPKKELEELTKVMLASSGYEPTRNARQVFQPEFQLKSISQQFFDTCEALFHHGEDDLHPFTPAELPGVEPPHENSAPIFRNQIDQLSAVVGHLFRFQVPDNTCYDMEDGNSRNLRMRILTIDLSPPSRDSWLHFDSANQEFFGIPLREDIGRKEYLLECMDEGGEGVSDALIVEVLEEEGGSHKTRPVIFSLTVDTPFDAFIRSPLDKARFVDRLGRAFGDAQPEHSISILSFARGSVRIEWHNSTLSNDPCPRKEAERLRRIMTDDTGRLRTQFKSSFLPDFRVTDGGSVVPSGSCLGSETPTYAENPDDLSGNRPAEDEVASPSAEDHLLTFIIPAVVIASMLFFAALIACCLYRRRRRYGKMRMAGNDGDRRYVSKGVPVIFAEELDERRPERAPRTPVVMKEEKPPLPPPEYPRAMPPRSAAATAPRTAPADIDSSADEGHAPYHRPPPFATATNGSSHNQRHNPPPPAYRKTPTYVPP